MSKLSNGMLSLLAGLLAVQLACGGGGGGSTGAASAAVPVITGFSISPPAIQAGATAQLQATFSNGTGTVQPGALPLASGSPLTVSPATTTTYTLTVQGAGGTATATATLTVTPQPQRLFLSDTKAPGLIRIYDLPLSAASVPAVSIPFNNSIALAQDASGALAVATNNSQVAIFTAPYSNASTPAATFTSGGSQFQLAFGPSAKLYLGTQGASLNIYTPPFSGGTVASGTITDPNTTAMGVAFDASSNLYLSGSSTRIVVRPSEGTAAATAVLTLPAGAAVRSLAVNTQYLAAASVGNAPGAVFLYALPLTSASTPFATLTSGVGSPEGVAFDASGNLYVSNLSTGNVLVFTPPFSSASAPSVTLPTGANLFCILIGK